MFQTLLDGQPLRRIKRQSLCEEVNCGTRSVREEFSEVTFLLEGESTEVVSRTTRVDLVEFVEGRSSRHAEDEGELIVIYDEGVGE